MPEPITFILNGQRVTLDESALRDLGRALCQALGERVWPTLRGNFDMAYGRWEWFNRNPGFNWMITLLAGGADLPRPSVAQRLRNLRNRMNMLITDPSRAGEFLSRLEEFSDRSADFITAVYEFERAFDIGGGRAVTGLTITRNASFATLSVLASLLSLGAAAPAAAAAGATGTTALETLAGAAAQNFVITQLQHSADRLGRTMAGERVTWRETREDLFGTAVDAMSGAMLEQITAGLLPNINRTMEPLIRQELTRGNLGLAAGGEFTRSQIQSAITSTVQALARSGSDLIRSALRSADSASDEAAAAGVIAETLARDRRFLTRVGEELAAAAPAGARAATMSGGSRGRR